MFRVPSLYGVSVLTVLLRLLWVASAANAAKNPPVTALSGSQISWYKPFTYFASASYCKPPRTLAWDCGVNCEGNPDFIPTASGGNGALKQYWYVGYDPEHTTVIVGYQGTNLTEFFADFTDANFFLAPLDHELFPGLAPPILAHSGFLAAHARTSDDVFEAVKVTLAAHAADSISVVGHSLGAALALLETISLQLRLPGMPVQHVGYGTPRVGNADFVHWVDEHCPGRITRIINHKDPVGIVPGRFLGYEHVAGEIYITDTGSWMRCAGNDNPSQECATGDTVSVFDAEAENHNGPFDGVKMGCPTT